MGLADDVIKTSILGQKPAPETSRSSLVDVVYDRLGRKTQLNDPDLGVSNFSVNPLGQVWQQVDAKNQTTKFTYDDLNRLTHRLEADLDSYWVYDTAAQGIGKLAEAYTLRGDGTKDYRRVQAYDSLSRPASSTITLDQDYGTSWTYDGLGRPSTVIYSRNAVGGSGGPAVGFASVYNSHGYLLQTQSTGGSHGTHVEWQALAQDAEQRVTREQLGDGRYTDRRFNTYTGTLDAISAGVDNGSNGDDSSLENESYLYDSLNDLTYRAQRKPDGSLLQESFGYDALNRLTSSQVGGQAQRNYAYDEIGNLVYKDAVGGYAYPASGSGSVRPHAVTSISGSVAGQANPSFGYDANGNLTSGAGRTMALTSFDLPASITRSNAVAGTTNTAIFAYGPEHQRARQTVTGSNPTTIYYGGAIEEEVTSAGTTIKTRMPRGIGYIEESSANPTPQGRYVRDDHLGSSVVMTDESGALLDRLSYDPWGQRRNTDGSDDTTFNVMGKDRIGYTGQEELDTIGLVHLNGRVYDPLVGRFISADPTIPDVNDSQSLNRYAYVRNNPLNATDPTGFEEAIVTDDGVQHGPRVEVDGNKPVSGFYVAGAPGTSPSNFGRRYAQLALPVAAAAAPPAGGQVGCKVCKSKQPTLEDQLLNNSQTGHQRTFEEWLSSILTWATGGDESSGDQPADKKSGPEKPADVPGSWEEVPGKKDGNTKWVNPDNPHDYVRSKPDGTLTQVRDGKAYDENGNRVDLSSPAAHGITPDRFIFVP